MKRNYIKLVWSGWSLLFFMMLPCVTDAEVIQELEVIDHNIMSSRRVSRTDFEYDISLLVRNPTSEGFGGVLAQATSRSSYVTVVQPFGNIGEIASMASKRADSTITIRVNRTRQFAPESLDYAFFGDVIVPEGDIAGADVNLSGVRDDVEDYIDGRYSLTSQEALILLDIARLYQERLQLEPTQEFVQNSIIKGFMYKVCLSRLSDTHYSQPQEIWSETINTYERLQAYKRFSDLASRTFINGYPDKSEQDQFCQMNYGL